MFRFGIGIPERVGERETEIFCRTLAFVNRERYARKDIAGL